MDAHNQQGHSFVRVSDKYTEVFDPELLRQMQLKSLANLRLNTGVIDALSSLEETDDMHEPEEFSMEESRFEAKQMREMQRLEWLVSELERLTYMAERALSNVETSDAEAGLGYDRIVGDELDGLAQGMRVKIEGDARRLAKGDKWVDF